MSIEIAFFADWISNTDQDLVKNMRQSNFGCGNWQSALGQVENLATSPQHGTPSVTTNINLLTGE